MQTLVGPGVLQHLQHAAPDRRAGPGRADRGVRGLLRAGAVQPHPLPPAPGARELRLLHLAAVPAPTAAIRARRAISGAASGTGMENPARFGEAIYGQGVGPAVGAPVHRLGSAVGWAPRCGRRRRFPAEPATRMTVRLDQPRTFTVSIRRPGWAGAGFAVRVNGDAAPASGLVPRATWTSRARGADGDRVDVALPDGAGGGAAAAQTPHFAAVLLRAGGAGGRAGAGRPVGRPLPLPDRGQGSRCRAWAETPGLPRAVARRRSWRRSSRCRASPLAFRTKGLAQSGRGDADAPFARSCTTSATRSTGRCSRTRRPGSATSPRATRIATGRCARSWPKGAWTIVLPGDADLERAHKQHGERSNAGVFEDRPWRDASGRRLVRLCAA
jgi:hypothetical protein